jgi:thiamine-monophosphate kinase
VSDGEPGPTLGQLGEFPLIDLLVSGRRQPATTALGPGDDAAVVFAADGRTAVSTDMLVQDRHFRLDWSTPHHVGRKAIAQNAADIEAMGGRATAFVVAFGAPADTPAERVSALADGMWEEAERIGAGIVGGDLVSCPQWVVSVTVLGDLAGRAPVLRAGARPGSMIAVVGELGRSAAGYALWHNGLEGFDELRCRHLVPQPPYGQGGKAADAGAQAMIDVSDGLVADVTHIADASGVTPGRGCSAGERTTPWSRHSPARSRPGGGSSGGCWTGRPGCSSTPRSGTDTRAGSRLGARVAR